MTMSYFLFLNEVLNEILIGTPQELEAIALAVQALFPDFTAYAERAQKGSAAADQIHKNTLSIVNACFDYDEFAKKSDDWGAYGLVEAHDIRVCPYCQAQHVNYYIEPNASRLSERYRIRPPLDHFLPRSLYPFLAVSLCNLVPSCHQCNSSIKTSADPLYEGVASPLDVNSMIAISFSAKGSIPAICKGTVDDVRLDLTATDLLSVAHVEFFFLKKRYEWYRHEVRDLIARYHYWHTSVPAQLRNSLSGDDFMLGFSPSRASERAIGLCLQDLLGQLKCGMLV